MRNRYETLVIEDEDLFLVQLRRALGETHSITSVKTFQEAREVIQQKPFDLVLLDKNLPNNQSGLELIPILKLNQPQAVIIVLTADKPLDNSVLSALQAGAADYLQKVKGVPVDIVGRISVAFNRLHLERRLSKIESMVSDEIHSEMIGQSEAMRTLRDIIRTLSQSEINLLILGETGTGKELVARSLNASHGDKGRPFIRINCGAITPSLIESELFGHAKGSFTGAFSDKKGKVELANGGDLFLDEIGELPLDVQVKLLRVLQDGEFSRVGCNHIRYSKFRIISATNRDLQQMIKEQKFREDLYYRIAGYEIGTTPLRERVEDIPPLIEFFVRRKEGPHFKVAPEVIDFFQSQYWKGNIRELKNRVEAALTFAKARDSRVISLEDALQNQQKRHEIKISVISKAREFSQFQYVAQEYENYRYELDKTYIMGALSKYDWDLESTAKFLGISRSNIYQKVEKYGLKRSREFIVEGLQ